MKALSRKTREQKDNARVDKYIRDNYEQIIYDSMAENFVHIVRQTVAEMLYGMSQNGYGKKRLHKVLGWFNDVNAMPEDMLGKRPDAESVMKYMKREYDIDFDTINPNYQTYEEYKKDGSA